VLVEWVFWLLVVQMSFCLVGLLCGFSVCVCMVMWRRKRNVDGWICVVVGEGEEEAKREKKKKII
jgi:hypothetical protein